jgi:hypothetical protein
MQGNAGLSSFAAVGAAVLETFKFTFASRPTADAAVPMMPRLHEIIAPRTSSRFLDKSTATLPVVDRLRRPELATNLRT